MIDWFPPAAADVPGEDPAGDLARWRTGVHLRRVALTVDSRAPATQGHSERVAEVAAHVARELGWGEAGIGLLREAGLVHDVGLACVPDEVLFAPAPLSLEGYELVKAHPTMGAELTAAALGEAQVAWVRHHHERWDGGGYPYGLAGHAIPAGAAILAVAEAWDAMTHDGWAGEARGTLAALAECRRQAGRQFAPWVVDALRRVVRSGAPIGGDGPAAPLRLVPSPGG